VTAAGFRERLRAGDRLVGTFVSTPDGALAELLGEAFDVVVVDLEHSAIGAGDMQLIAIAAQARGSAVLARVPHADSELLAIALDAGLDGVVVPSIDSAAQARDTVARLRYPPAGRRGFGPRRANRYGRDGAYRLTADDGLACVVQIESAAGVDAAAAIAAVAGVDALLVGPADLSFALGTPLDPSSAPMRLAIDATQAAASAAGIASGIASNVEPHLLGELVDDRCTLLLQSTDLRMYAAVADRTAAAARAALQALPRAPLHGQAEVNA